MKGTILAMAFLLILGSLSAANLSVSIDDISPTPTKLANYSYQTTLKNGTALATDTVKNSRNLRNKRKARSKEQLEQKRRHRGGRFIGLSFLAWVYFRYTTFLEARC